jgi:hypothetical protein
MWRLFDSQRGRMAAQRQRPTMATKGRSTAAETAARVDTIMTMLLRGAPRSEMCAFAQKTWDVSEDSADRYISKATAQIETITQPRREYEFALVRTRLEDLYAKTYGQQDYYTALRVLNQITALTGVNAPVKTETDVTSGGKPLPILITKMDMDKL